MIREKTSFFDSIWWRAFVRLFLFVTIPTALVAMFYFLGVWAAVILLGVLIYLSMAAVIEEEDARKRHQAAEKQKEEVN
jgi:predicted membrane protein